MAVSRAGAQAIRLEITVASGKFFLYRRGISFTIAPIFKRAGLKIAA